MSPLVVIWRRHLRDSLRKWLAKVIRIVSVVSLIYYFLKNLMISCDLVETLIISGDETLQETLYVMVSGLVLCSSLCMPTKPSLVLSTCSHTACVLSISLPADPGWGSCTLGVFICLACSGIHRNFPDISKVKSLSLSRWEDHEMQVRPPTPPPPPVPSLLD